MGSSNNKAPADEPVNFNEYIEAVRVWNKKSHKSLDEILSEIPHQYIETVLRAGLSNQNLALTDIPKKYINKELCYRVVDYCRQGDKKILHQIPDEFLSSDIYYTLWHKTCIDIRDVPDDMIDDLFVFKYIRAAKTTVGLQRKFITKKILIYCVYCMGEKFQCYNEFPEEFFDEEFYTVYFTTVRDLKNIPVKFWTEHMLIEYIRSDNYVTSFKEKIPESLNTDLVKTVLNIPREHISRYRLGK